MTLLKQLPTDYQNFIHKSRYARFLDSEGRRENWDETVTRYFDYFQQDLDERHGYKVPELLVSELRDAVSNLHIMPSMRAMMTAGEAARRENISVYNCAYLPIDKPKAFAEVLYILMCGTGVGFSVERQIIKQLPEVPNELIQTDDEIIVQDSKRGWAQGFLELVEHLYAGRVPRVRTHLVRGPGERLKTFGGRASGPAPLLALCEFTVRTFHGAKGRRLNSLEVHEICTMTGKAVVVGGVRRSAEISLSNLSDLRMRDAKSGNWYVDKPHLAIANNSVAYTEKPEVGQFMEEWLSLYRSNSGERGIYNRYGAIEKIQRLGRRDHNYEFGTNPCGEIILRPRGLCNLSTTILREGDSLREIREKIQLASILGTWQSTQTTFKFVEPEWKINCEEERLLGVSLTGIFDNALMRGDEGLDRLAVKLQDLKQNAIKANRIEANAIGINPSLAVTTVKPEGTVSQMVRSSSGIHHGHAPQYIRRVTQDNKDPVTQFMHDMGIPNEPHEAEPQAMTVFSFPIQLGKHTMTRNQQSAIQHLELVKLYNLNWSEHAVSCTVSVDEEEWPEVGGWVYRNFDLLAGVSFLPRMETSSVYTQLPYETITEDLYETLSAKMPKDIDWTKLGEYEGGTDTVTGTREFACVGNMCEIVESQSPLPTESNYVEPVSSD
jgi:ribonucleoside-diphosphate reductase alpha chain